MRRSDGEAIEEALEDAPREALAMVRALLEQDDQDADLWAYLAECRTEIGDREAALADWAHYLVLDPHWPEAYTARCELFADSGDLRAARAELALVKGFAEEDARVIRTEALLAEFSGDYNTADALYADAEESDPLWPAPKRYKRNRAAKILRKELSYEEVHVEELPTSPEPDGLLRRAELRSDGSLTIYLRNLERDLAEESDLEDLVEAAQDAVDDLEQPEIN